jgi:hypothetical protein
VTNGKTTVTTLVDAMLRARDLQRRRRNIGHRRRAGDRARRRAEVSSFQPGSPATLAPDVAVLLNVAEDHLLDWHGSVAATPRQGRGSQLWSRVPVGTATTLSPRPGCQRRAGWSASNRRAVSGDYACATACWSALPGSWRPARAERTHDVANGLAAGGRRGVGARAPPRWRRLWPASRPRTAARGERASEVLRRFKATNPRATVSVSPA